MLKRQAAELLGVSPARVSQLIRDGYLKPSPDGSITAAAVEHCRRHAPVAWQIPGAKSGRKSAAQAEQERKDRLWRLVAAKMAGMGYQGWQGRHCRDTYRDLKRCIQAVDGRLMADW
jgi:DNA-binding transcriptional regulator YdaS (Cro superfamily)